MLAATAGLLQRRSASACQGATWPALAVASACNFSSQVALPCLLRDFLHDSLVHPEGGYFSKQAHGSSVGKLQEPLRFDLLLGETGWRAQQQKLYRQLQTSWLTPVEIFKPWYGQAIARYIVQHHMKHAPKADLNICEVGGGQGTLAANILDYLRTVHPGLYKHTFYRSLEVSAPLIAAQTEYVSRDCGHGARYRASLGDARNEETWGPSSPDYTYVIAMEVLDNLPHDRVQSRGASEPWGESWVVRDENAPNGLREECRPLQDALIRRCLECTTWDSPAAGADPSAGTLARIFDAIAGVSADATSASGCESIFLPTGALQLFETLHRRRPHHHFICADFAWLSDVRVAGANAPLISATTGGRNQDYDTYLLPRGQADIFFPSNFSALKALWSGAASSSSLGNGRTRPVADVLTTSEFMTLHAQVHRTKTIGAFNPLLDDFLNTSFLLADTGPPSSPRPM